MNSEKKIIDTISGRDAKEVNRQLIIRTAKIYEDLETTFIQLSDKTVKQNLKIMLQDFAKEARDDKEKIMELLEGKEPRIETSKIEYSMFDHLKREHQSDEEEKLILDAIKKSEEIRNVFTLLTLEYASSDIKNTFDILVNHEKLRKNQLEELYDEIITKGEW